MSDHHWFNQQNDTLSANNNYYPAICLMTKYHHSCRWCFNTGWLCSIFGEFQDFFHFHSELGRSRRDISSYTALSFKKLETLGLIFLVCLLSDQLKTLVIRSLVLLVTWIWLSPLSFHHLCHLPTFTLPGDLNVGIRYTSTMEHLAHEINSDLCHGQDSRLIMHAASADQSENRNLSMRTAIVW